MRSQTAGTAEMLLTATVSGFQSFSVIGDGNTTFYSIEDHAGNWEVGLGTVDNDSTQLFLFRDTVYSSSNSGALVNFPQGGKTISTTVPAAFLAQLITLTGYTP
jgi:hypothetical protein